MDTINITFDDNETEEYECHQYRSFISMNSTNINKIVVSNKFPFSRKGSKYFISYKDNKKVKPLCILFPETNEYY